MPLGLRGQFQVQTEALQEPDSILPHLLKSANFWKASIDSVDGGFYTEVNQDGSPERTDRKSFTQCSRHAYGFSRAFMVSGDTTYLDYAEHALDFLYQYGWDQSHLGWYFSSDKYGVPAPPYGAGWNPNTTKWSFQQHYSVLGIGAMAEATRDPRHLDWLDLATQVNDSLLWDDRPGFQGFYHTANEDWSNLRDKGFTATVDGITTWVLWRALLTDAPADKDRLIALADNIVDHLYASMLLPQVQFGFAEGYNSNWNLNNGNTGGSVGHVIKTAWCLARAYMFDPKPIYREAAQYMINEMMFDGGYDYTNGGIYMNYNWSTGAVTQNKDYWMLEQGLTSGLINYFLATDSLDKELNLGMADGCLGFLLEHFVDPVYGEIYSQTNAAGNVINNDKSDPFKGGYHNIEMSYLTYVYGHLFYHEDSVTLYYRFRPQAEARQFKMTPIAIRDDLLGIASVTLDGQPYANYDALGRTLDIPANTGGIFAVTYYLTSPFVSNEALATSEPVYVYPNPAQETIGFHGLRQAAEVYLFDLQGRQVQPMQRVEAGQSLSVHGLPAGMYV
ncbi:MAG: T9SS C-terminal target domain-containing protein, partial [Bacteroidetes bacterium]